MVSQDPEAIVDSGSSIFLIKNKILLVNEVVQKCENPIMMETNAGDTNVYEGGDVIDYRT